VAIDRDDLNALADALDVSGIPGLAAAPRLVRAARRRNLVRNLRREVRAGLKRDARLAEEPTLAKQLAGDVAKQLVDPEFLAATRRLVETGDAATLPTLRAHLATHVATRSERLSSNELAAIAVEAMFGNLARSQRDLPTAIDVRASATESLLTDHIDRSSDRIAKLIAAGTTGPNLSMGFWALEWAPQGAHVALRNLGETAPGVLVQLQERVGDPADVDEVVALLEDWPDWLVAGGMHAAAAVAKLCEQGGCWQDAAVAWERGAYATTGSDQAAFFVRTAIAHQVAGAPERYREFIEKARAIDPNHPRLLLEELDADQDPDQQLATLERVETDDVELGALAELHRCLAYLVKEDLASARGALERAEAVAPSMVQVKQCRVNLTVQEGRSAAASDRAINGPAVAEALASALELREEMLSQRRFEEAGRLLMLAVDAAMLGSEPARATELIDAVTDDELAPGVNSEVLAEAALRCSRYDTAARCIATAPPSLAKRRIAALSRAMTGHSDTVLEAVGELEDLARGDDQDEALKAASSRAILSIEKPQLGWDEGAEHVMAGQGHLRGSVGSKAMFLAQSGQPEDAMELLEASSAERWALEAMVRVSKRWGRKSERRRAAERLLAIGPDQGMRLECAQALAAAGELERGRDVALQVAHEHSAPVPLRCSAYRLLMQIVGNDLGDWARAGDFHDEWTSLAPGDDDASAWMVRVYARRPQTEPVDL
jgi:tetratricopeptide (TPR) repeat protein